MYITVPIIILQQLLFYQTLNKTTDMSHQKKFGIWMDTHHATVVSSEDSDGKEFTVIGHVEAEANTATAERNSNNQSQDIMQKYFKEISKHLTNATHIHITGTGTAQEQFIHYLADTAEFKNTKTEESTSNKMSDEKLVEYIAGK